MSGRIECRKWKRNNVRAILIMTEEEWLACTDPTPMLEFYVATPAINGKLRLFACACCRRIWSLILDERWRRAVEAAEKYADQTCNRERLRWTPFTGPVNGLY